MNDNNVLESLKPEQALAVMNKLVEVHNLMVGEKPAMGWFCMGVLVEKMASRVRGSEQPLALSPPGKAE